MVPTTSLSICLGQIGACPNPYVRMSNWNSKTYREAW